jgi:hypothetical protein
MAVSFYLNPFSSWSFNSSSHNNNQIVSMDTYQLLIKQELSETHSLTNNVSNNTQEHFQKHYQNFTKNDIDEIKVTIKIVSN